MARIISHPNIPPFDTPEFWHWLECWHAKHNGHVGTRRDTFALEPRLRDTLVEMAVPPGLRRFAGAIDAAGEQHRKAIQEKRQHDP